MSSLAYTPHFGGLFTSGLKMAEVSDKTPVDFSGFRGDVSLELSLKLYQRKFYSLEETVNQVLERLARTESEQKELSLEVQGLKKELRKAYMMNNELQEENNTLRKQLQMEATEVKKWKEEVKNTVKEVKEHKNVWSKVQKENEESFRKILDSQQKAKDEMKNKVVSVIKEKEKLVRDTVDKVKCVVIFGITEEKIDNKIERETMEQGKVKEVLMQVVEENQTMTMVEEIHRIGKFEEGKNRPVKVKFATQARAEEVVNNAWKLAGKEKFKKVWINKDMDRDERNVLKMLVEQAKQKNLERKEEEKEQFYYQVRDLKIRRRVIRK